MNTYHYGAGKRKAATARAKYYPSTEALAIMVNKQEAKIYFPDYYLKTITEATKNMGIFTGELHFFVNGGGVSAQSEACRLAFAKSLVKMDDEMYRRTARSFGYMTTDIRMVAPKMAGLRKNRKREQWSKR